jgi:hypothetical protein
MGLDMYAFAVAKEDAIDALTIKQDAVREELFYWRKHHDLHGWMESLYREKGGEADSFNCVAIQLDEAELDDLERHVKEGMLPETTGFFFGNNPPDSESNEQDLKFIAKARQAIQEGKVVYYDSWW